jgi:hypothetical protein
MFCDCPSCELFAKSKPASDFVDYLWAAWEDALRAHGVGRKAVQRAVWNHQEEVLDWALDLRPWESLCELLRDELSKGVSRASEPAEGRHDAL